jgi:hypothetical protein
LKKGGKTAYFGDIGNNSETLIKYFERQSGKKCGEQDNPAEYILECVGAGATAKVSEDWGQLWQDSEERRKSDEYVAKLESDYKGKKSQADEAPDAGRSYAAPVMTQLRVVTHRAFQNYWRDPTYVFGKLALNIFGKSSAPHSILAQMSDRYLLQLVFSSDSLSYACIRGDAMAFTDSRFLRSGWPRITSKVFKYSKFSGLEIPLLVLTVTLLQSLLRLHGHRIGRFSGATDSAQVHRTPRTVRSSRATEQDVQLGRPNFRLGSGRNSLEHLRWKSFLLLLVLDCRKPK